MEPKAPQKARASALVVVALMAAGVLALDQFTKYLVVTTLTEGAAVPVLGDFLQVYFVRNPGAAFSLASGSTWIFSILAAAVMVAIIIFARRIRSLGWAFVFGMLLGGVMGNLSDRLFREPSFGLGHVVDFISTPWMMPAIYNVADIFIVSSMGLFMILTIRGIGLDGTRTPHKKRAAVHTAETELSAEHEAAVAPEPTVEPVPTVAPEPTVETTRASDD